MTKEKAIEILKEIIDEGWLISELNKCIAIDACEMAIKALEQEPCKDAISRQAAIDALRDAENHAFYSFYKGLVKAHKIIADLPPVTPQPKAGHWIGVSCYDAFGGDYEAWMVHGDPIAYHYCSECKGECYESENGEDILSDFCPHCGAKMQEGEENGDK